jgi:hypothetical protein
MTEQPTSPVPYEVSYSELVRDELRALLVRAKNRGLGLPFLAAAKAINERLSIYPQFGQPLHDLNLEGAQLWVGVVPPLVVHYVLDEAGHLVFVVTPFRPLPHSGL